MDFKCDELILGKKDADSRALTLDMTGCLISIDAMGCQTEIAAQIVDKGGDYLLAV